MSRKLSRALILVVGLALITSACANAVPGVPQAAPGAVAKTSSVSTSTKSPKTTTKASTTTKKASAAGFQAPCNLVTEETAKNIGVDLPGAYSKPNGRDTCEWKKTSTSSGGLAIITADALGGLDWKTAKSTTPIKVGNREAVKAEAPGNALSSCAVAIAVNEYSSVLIVGRNSATSTDTAAACGWVVPAAGFIEPLLS